MKHLFDNWEGIRDRIERSHFYPLLLDYDGTLTPIVSRPELAICSPEIRLLLERLRDLPNVYLASISGRTLEDIREKIGISQITYIGNHGLSIQNPAGIHKKKLSPMRQREFSKISQELRASLGQIPGILFEDKGLILAIHYRNSRRQDMAEIHEIVRAKAAEWKERWRISPGKMVLEVRPKVEFDKGQAVKSLLKIFSPRGLLPFYLGDDETDEDAFRAMKGRGIAIYVGSGEMISEADYYLENPGEVEFFLQRCENIFRRKSKISDGKDTN